MTIGELTRYLSHTKDGGFSPEAYDMWLNEVEGMVQTRIHLTPADEVTVYKRDFSDPDAFDSITLLAPPPFDKLYAPYIEARIDYANGEYDKYQNSMAMFEAFFTEYMAYYAATHRPADVRKRAKLGITI